MTKNAPKNDWIDELQLWACRKFKRRFQYRARLEYKVKGALRWSITQTISLNCQSDADRGRWIKTSLMPKGIKKTLFYDAQCKLDNGEIHLELAYLGWY